MVGAVNRPAFVALRFAKRARLGLLMLIALAGVETTVGVFAEDKKPPIPINYGGPTSGYYHVYVADKLGLFQKYGLEPHFFWMTSGTPLLAALKSKSIDVVSVGSPIVFALDQRIPMKIIFWELDNSQGEGLVVAKDSKLLTWRDINKAKAIGAATGTCAQANLALIAKQLNIGYKSLNVINLPPPLFRNAFSSGSIDAGLGWAPHSLTLQAAGYRILAWDPEYGGVCPSVVAARAEFLQQHPDVGVKLAKIQAESRAAIEKDPKLAIQALMATLSISEETAKAFYERHCCERMPTFSQQLSSDGPWSIVNKQGGLAAQLHTTSQMLFEAGTLRAPLSWEAIDDAIDPSYLRKAAADLQN